MTWPDLDERQQATVLKRGALVGRHDDAELYLYRGRFYTFGLGIAWFTFASVVPSLPWQPA